MIILLISYMLLFFSYSYNMDDLERFKLKLKHFKETEEYNEPADSTSGLRRSPSYYFEDELEQVILTGAFDAAYRCDLPRLRTLVTRENINTVNDKKQPVIFSTIKKSFDDPDAHVEPTLEFLIDGGACVDIVNPGHAMSALEFATRLTIASKHQNFRSLDFLLKQGANPFFAPRDKACSFDVALRFAHKNNPNKYPFAQEVLELFKSKSILLSEAVISCNINKVLDLADPKTVTEIDYDKKTPLYLAISRFCQFTKQDSLVIIEALLKAGAQPNEGIKQMSLPGNTHLIVATIISLIRGDCSMIKPLLEYGGDPDFKLKQNFPSAQNIAYEAGHLTLSMVEYWIRLGYEKEIKNIQANSSVAEEILKLFEKYRKRKGST